MAEHPPPTLPMAGGDGARRADAERNRTKILAAAERLVAEVGIENVSMDRLAREACVGKGTIFRRFGDRAGLALALLEEHEREFQESFIRGDPPLGPGAPPAERLRAFGRSFIDLIESHGDILLAAEAGAPGLRFRSGAYVAHQAHLSSLIAELDPRLDAEYHTEALLAVLAADHHLYLRRFRELPAERLKAGWDSMIDALEALAAR